MNTEFFIARRSFDKTAASVGISRPIINIAITGIALGIMVMIIAIAVVTGFKTTIKDKVFGFGSHIQIINYDSNNTFESIPISKQQDFLEDLKKHKGIKHVQVFANKTGIIRTKENVQAVVVKAIGSDYDWTFFEKHLIAGHTFKVYDSVKTDEVLISKILANKLELNVDDKFITSFVPQNNSESIRHRNFKVAGIYETQLEDFDKQFIIADIAHIQKLNNWDSTQISGFEIMLDDYNQIDQQYYDVLDIIGYGFTKDGSKLAVKSIEEINPMLFDWLELLDMNVWVILIIITIVAILNMTSGLLVIILEKTNMIGILKAIGANNAKVRRIFIYIGAFIIGKGMLLGNIIGLLLIAIEYYFRIVPLDETMYFISYVPVSIKISHLLAINICSLAITTFMLMFPSYIITKISPSESIKFE